jgi:ATP-binding cassette, subfamily B, bacterial PglK
MSALKKESPLFEMMLDLWGKIEKAKKRQIIKVLALMLIASFAEMVSIGAIFPFLSVLVNPKRLLQSHYTQKFISFFGISSMENLLLILTIFFCTVTLITALIKIVLNRVSANCSNYIGADLSLEMYRRTLYQPYIKHVSKNSSEVISQISGSGTLVGGVIAPSLSLINSVVLFVGILIALVIVSPTITLVVTVFFGLIYYLLMRLVKAGLQANGEIIIKESTKVTKSLQEGLSGIRDVLLEGAQEFYCRIYAEADLPLRRAYVNNVFLSISPRYCVEALGIVSIAILAYYLTKNGDANDVTIPILGSLALAAQRLLPVLQQIYTSIITIQGSKPTLAICLNYLNQPVPTDNFLISSELSFEKEIKLKDIDFQYIGGAKWNLRNININIPKGSCVGVMGPTGGGKSTLLDIFMGLIEPTNGNIYVDGVLINSSNIKSWRSHIAHVPQSIYLTDSSIAQNIAFGVDASLRDVDLIKKAARYAKLDKFIDGLPEGYDTNVGERGIKLSGGQRQRIGIARAIYRQADVLVFDEATSALDGNTEREVMDAINSLGKEVTIIMVAHRLTTLKNCNLIVEIDQGSIGRVGSYNNMITSQSH